MVIGAALLIATGCAEPGSDRGAGTAEALRIGGRIYPLAERVQFKLPKVLREISGLALNDSDRLFAHNDEQGIVYEIDYRAGKVVRRFALDGIVRSDFEGIAIAHDRLFLTTSRGEILETRVGEPEETVPFERHDARLDCEVEGLSFSPKDRALLVACKNLPTQDADTGLRVHLWDLDKAAYDPGRVLRVPRSALQDVITGADQHGIQPSGIAIATSGNLIVVAGRQHLLLELTPDGELVRTARLDAARHRQTEGIAVTTTGVLILADEGDSRGSDKSRGRLSVYVPAE